MATITFTSDFDWIVPDTNSEITITCRGGRGEDGSGETDSFSVNTTDGHNGGVVIGDRNVSPGDVLHIRIGGGGSGGEAHSSNFSDDYTDAYGGDGGDAADVRFGGTSLGNVIICAGGGGGGAASDEHVSVGSAGGGEAGDGESAGGNAYITHNPALGGESGGYFGGSGGSSSGNEYDDDGTDEHSAGAGGGGGGGHHGGTGGRTDYSGDDYHGAYADTWAGGGGGGDGDTSGVHNTDVTIGGHSGSAEVEIEFEPFPNPPLSLNAIPNHQAPNIELTWDVHDSITEGFNISRGTDPNFEHNVDNRIVRITNENARSYTDTNTERGVEYYYKISAWTNTYSEGSTAEGPAQATAGEVFKINEDGSFTQYPVRYWDASEWDFASELSVFSAAGYSTVSYGDSDYESPDGGEWQEQ